MVGGMSERYIARRLIRCATEDIGLADPQALLFATRCFDACIQVGYPQCAPILYQTVSYLSLTSKSNELYLAYGKVRNEIHVSGCLPVPLFPSEDLYQTSVSHLPEQLLGTTFYDIRRGISDLREPSLRLYTDPEAKDGEEKEKDANAEELPLEKRVKLELKDESERTRSGMKPMGSWY